MSENSTERSKKEEENSNATKKSKESRESKNSKTSKNNSKSNSEHNKTNIEESKDNSKENNSEKKKANDDEILIEVIDKAVNTDDLNKSELDRLIKENKELQEVLNDDKGNQINKDNNLYNIEHDTLEIPQTKKALIEEIMKNEEIKEILIKSNNEFSNKIKLSEKKLKEIMDKISQKKGENKEEKLELQIKELEKEIKANNSETERYKKLIENIKDQIEFKEGIERASNLQKILKQETLKNIELKDKLRTLDKINKYQTRFMSNYEKKHKTKEKETQLKNEISLNKNSIKDYNNKYLKLDRFIKAAHSRIMGVKIYIDKILNQPKIEEKKIFTNEETKDTIEVIANLKSQIYDKRKELDEIQKKSENKMHELLVRNKQIEMDYLENRRIFKSLIYQKNEINKKLKNINNENKKTKQNQNIKINENKIKEEVKKDDKKEAKIEDKKEDKKEVKKDYIKEVKKEDKKEIKKEVKKEVKIENTKTKDKNNIPKNIKKKK